MSAWQVPATSPYTVTSGSAYTIDTVGTYTISPSTTAEFSDVGASSLHVKGNTKIEGELEINGKNIMQVLEGIEKRLAILHPNKKLEEKWGRLKALGDMYRELEKEIIEKEHIWSTLKK